MSSFTQHSVGLSRGPCSEGVELPISTATTRRQAVECIARYFVHLKTLF